MVLHILALKTINCHDCYNIVPTWIGIEDCFVLLLET